MSDKIQAIRFKQWLPEWDEFDFDPSEQRRKPDPHILLFSMPAIQLRALSGVFRRKRNDDKGVGLQRMHEVRRSAKIRDFVKYGHPYSSLNQAARTEENEVLRRPGWLPTAIVVNLLQQDDVRPKGKVAAEDLIGVNVTGASNAELTLPYDNHLEQWQPKALEPIEVIDGQHRLWAFDEAFDDGSLPADFELPVVAFSGLDLGWQAYLFWSINVSPKKINPSHAFDLFPLLRSQKWLETFSELKVYREARSQELTEFLFNHPESPWQQRINMLGESSKSAPSRAGVTQNGWVRALLSSYLTSGGGRTKTNGLFAANITDASGPLSWSRARQAGFLILLWNSIADAIGDAGSEWTESLRKPVGQESFEDGEYDPAFSGSHTMLNQEQGVRGVLAISNDLMFALAKLETESFEFESDVRAGDSTDEDDVTMAIAELQGSAISNKLRVLGLALADFDWRSSKAPGLSEETRHFKMAFRGSGGYATLRQELMKFLASNPDVVAEFPNLNAKN